VDQEIYKKGEGGKRAMERKIPFLSFFSSPLKYYFIDIF